MEKIIFADELANSVREGGSAIFTKELISLLPKHTKRLLAFSNTPFRYLALMLKIPFLRELTVFPLFGLYAFLEARKSNTRIIQFSSVTSALLIPRSTRIKRIIIVHCLFSRQIKAIQKQNTLLYRLLFNNLLYKIFVCLEKISFSHVNDIIVPRHSIAKLIHKTHAVPSKKIRVIPQGVNIKKFTDLKSAREPALLFVGRPSIMKGFPLFCQLVKQLPQYQFIIVSTQRIPAKLATEIPSAKIIINAPHEKLHAIYNKVKLLIMPSLIETGPLVTLEAMACGLPVVCSPEGAGEFVRDNYNGYIIKQPLVEEYIKKIQALWENKRWYIFSENARSTVETHYSLDKVAKKYLCFYKACINKPYKPDRNHI